VANGKTGIKKLDEVFGRWRAENQRVRDEHATWEQANPELWAAWREASDENWDWNQRQRAAAERRERVASSGISERAIDAWLGGLEKWPAVEALQDWMLSGKTFLLLLGVTGTGKTVAAAEAIASTYGVGIFRRAVEMARMSVFDRADRDKLEQIRRCDLLVIDDLGTEMAHDGWRPVLDEVIDVRYGGRRQTIITSNLDAKMLRARYGDRVMDRIRDDGMIASCGDKSRRGQHESR
jgi:DNA replication protein DnaC